MNPIQSFQPDQPKNDPNHDLFGYAPFAQRVAAGISGYDQRDGLVISLYGPWGSGKSTALKYVEKYLDTGKPKDKLIVTNFNPWWFSGTENLAKALIRQLSAALPGELVKLKGLLTRHASSIGMFADLVSLGNGVPTGGRGKQVGKAIEEKLAEPEDIHKFKEEVSKELEKINKKIVVFIDDVDRLLPDEMRQLFTAIRALADFPNVIYVLALDKEVVVDAITKHMGMPGEQFLEKIIQVPLDLPRVNPTRVNSMLIKQLEKLLGDKPNEHFFEPLYWHEIQPHLFRLFQTPRDVVRFSNALSLTYSAVANEVNFLDFVALEAIRCFSPSLYTAVYTERAKFTSFDFGARAASSNLEQFLRSWDKNLESKRQQSCAAMLRLIFPILGNHKGVIVSPDKWLGARLARHPDMLPIYFELSIPVDQIGINEMLEFVQSNKSAQKLSSSLLELSRKRDITPTSKAHQMISLICAQHELVRDDLGGILAKVVLDIGDQLLAGEQEHPHFLFRPEVALLTCVVKELSTVNSVDVMNVLAEAISKGSGLYIQGYFLHEMRSQHFVPGQQKFANRFSEFERRLKNSSDAFFAIVNCWSSKVAKQLASIDDRFFKDTLYLWNSFAKEGNTTIQNWCSENTTSDTSLINFIDKCRTTMISTEKVSCPLDTRFLTQFLDCEVVKVRLTNIIQSDGFDNDSLKIAQEFIAAMETAAK